MPIFYMCIYTGILSSPPPTPHTYFRELKKSKGHELGGQNWPPTI